MLEFAGQTCRLRMRVSEMQDLPCLQGSIFGIAMILTDIGYDLSLLINGCPLKLY